MFESITEKANAFRNSAWIWEQDDALVLIQEGLEILQDNPDANITFTGVIRNGMITVITKDNDSN